MELRLYSDLRSAPVHLTPRERNVILLRTRGYSYRQIARQLFITKSTVSVDISRAGYDRPGDGNELGTDRKGDHQRRDDAASRAGVGLCCAQMLMHAASSDQRSGVHRIRRSPCRRSRHPYARLTEASLPPGRHSRQSCSPRHAKSGSPSRPSPSLVHGGSVLPGGKVSPSTGQQTRHNEDPFNAV